MEETKRFEITIDGAHQAPDHASRAEADTAAETARKAHPGKNVVVHESAANAETERIKAEAEQQGREPAAGRAEQGTPGNPAGAPQR